MTHYITLIPGDGIGPEVADAVTYLIEKTGVSIKWDKRALGLAAFKKYGESVPKETFQSIRDNGVALKGPTTTPVGAGHRSANVLLRLELDLFACIRPVRTTPGIKTRYEDVDLVIFRENTEGLYVGHEVEPTKDCVVSMKVATKKACDRITRSAFQYAEKHGRKTITLAHKANILKRGDGLFLNCAEKISKEYPGISYQDAIIDALCMRLVVNPTQFDMILCENLYGDIISDLCAGFIGGLGLVPGMNKGENTCVFEAVHGSAPDIAGLGLANPTALLRSATLMLEHIDEADAANRINAAIDATYATTPIRTRDLGGTASTKEFVEAVVTKI